MVMSNHSWEEQTRRLLTEAQSELTTLEAQINELVDKKIQLGREVEGYRVALEGYLRRSGREISSEVNWAILFKDLNHREKLIALAEHQGGSVRTSQATDILYSNGFIKAKKRATAYSMVQVHLSELTEEGKFTKIGPGEFRLVGAQPSLLEKAAKYYP